MCNISVAAVIDAWSLSRKRIKSWTKRNLSPGIGRGLNHFVQNSAINSKPPFMPLKSLEQKRNTDDADRGEPASALYIVETKPPSSRSEKDTQRRRREGGLNNKGRTKRKKQTDNRQRKLSARLTATECRALQAIMKANRGSRFITLDFHPAFMHQFPERPLVDWFKDELRSRIANWCKRRGIPHQVIWVRESYEPTPTWGRREHIHLIIGMARKIDGEVLLSAVRRWYPGDDQMVHSREVDWSDHAPGSRYAHAKALTYRLKQCDAQAVFNPNGRPKFHREKWSRHDKSPVAPVLGKRCGWSRCFNAIVKEAEDAYQSWKANAVWKHQRRHDGGAH